MRVVLEEPVRPAGVEVGVLWLPITVKELLALMIFSVVLKPAYRSTLLLLKISIRFYMIPYDFAQRIPFYVRIARG
jgi:hypothetical protein